VPYNHTHYFVEAGAHRGIEYETFELFEDQLNAGRGKGAARVNVVYVPLARGELLNAVVDGRADVAAGGITLTPERQQQVAFTRPTLSGVREVLVTAPGTPVLTSTEALSGQSVFVRPTSSYASSLMALNERLGAAGLAPVELEPAPEVLEDEDILEMVNAALVPATVVDSYLAGLWREVLPRLVVHDGVVLREGADLAWAVRPDSVQLRAALDDFLARHGAGSTTGNVLIRRYVGTTSLVRRASSGAERKRFDALAPLFQQYGARYQLDWLLLTAQAFQESRLDQSARSRAGAVGVMQLLPATGRAMGVGDIRHLDPNVHAGAKYLRSVIDQYFTDEEIERQDRMLFAFAAYNMGPARMRQLRRNARTDGADPNVWFDHVERSAERRVGREPVRYVSNIFKYYVSYRLLEEHRSERERAKEQLRSPR
jgi:membrane-bound lytic murein transglycosylase MltF